MLKFAKVSSPPEYQLNQHASFSVASASLSGAESFTIPKSYAYTVHQSSEGEVWDYSVTGTLTATFAPLAFTLGEAAAGNRAVASGVTRAAGGVGPYQVTFSADNPGAVSVPMDMVAATFPDATMVDWVGKHAEWEISPIGDSHDAATYTSLDWDTSVLGDALTGEGDSPVATFTGLPLYNKDFGNKVVMMTLRDPNDGHAVLLQKAGWQVFFPRDAANNPGVRGLPNWFEYWGQTFVPLQPQDSPPPSYSVIPGQTSWFHPGTNRIEIAEGVALTCYVQPYNTTEKCGIDRFTFTMIHEAQHYVDWVVFWQNDKTHYLNVHAGRLDPEDDGDRDGLPNWFEDTNGDGLFNYNETYNWAEPLTVSAAPPDRVGDPFYSDFEDKNYREHYDVTGYHDLDWSNPGFQSE